MRFQGPAGSFDSDALGPEEQADLELLGQAYYDWLTTFIMHEWGKVVWLQSLSSVNSEKSCNQDRYAIHIN